MSMEIAKDGMARVLKRWGFLIPEEVRRYKAEDIFRFHESNVSFLDAFHMTYEVLFKRANGLKCASDQIGSGCGAFVTPTQSHEARLIHVHPDNLKKEFDPLALMSHEYIHFASHSAFYPKYYGGGGDNPFRVEGATEWLNLQCYSNYWDGLTPTAVAQSRQALIDAPPTKGRFTRKNRAAYRTNYEATKAWIKLDSVKNTSKLVNYVFRGISIDPKDFSSIRP